MKTLTRKPLIGITMGDPSGIGPEILVRALSDGSLQKFCRPFAIGDPMVLQRALDLTRSFMKILPVTSPEAVSDKTGSLYLMAGSALSGEDAFPVAPTPHTGHRPHTPPTDRHGARQPGPR